MQLIVTKIEPLVFDWVESKIGPSPFVCETCGAKCCKTEKIRSDIINLDWLSITSSEYVALKPHHRRLVKIYKVFPKPYHTRLIPLIPEGRDFVKIPTMQLKERNGEMVCTFLSEENKCMIQYAKPSVCKRHVCSEIEDRIKEARRILKEKREQK